MQNVQNNSVGVIKTNIIRIVDESESLKLVSGKSLSPIDVAYETYGNINTAGSNVILICHALSGSAHAAGFSSPEEKKPGWWDIMIGPGKAIDTNKYYVICSNFLGSCSGTTGPSSINPKTGKPYNLDFPLITIADMVKVQKLLLDKLGIKQLLSVIGGSMGGMQVLQWAIEYPDFIKSAIVIAATARLGPQSIAFDAVGRNAILADIEAGRPPKKGLATARMIGHITYLSKESMREKFGRVLKDTEKYSYDFNSEFSVETYLNHQGQSFVERFDANSYLYITKAMDYFDLVRDYGSLENAFAKTRSRFLIVSFTSDWLFTPGQSEEIVNALVAQRKSVSYTNIFSPYGHDAFLLEPESLGKQIGGFLSTTLEKPNSMEQQFQV
jgi:homoserine O-acetyltransferase/O-succinyltransferase